MRMHLCSQGMVINIILSAEVFGEINVGYKHAKIAVEVHLFNESLNTQFNKACKDNISVVMAAIALCCGPEKI